MPGFEKIVGHEQIVTHLKNAMKLGKVSHAYILSGEKGCGKKLLADVFAETLQCEKKEQSLAEAAIRVYRQRAGTTRILYM